MNEQLEEQASFYALDLLEPDEARAFEAELEKNSELRECLDAYREAAASIAHGATWRQPPAALEAKIMNSIRTEKPSAVAHSPAKNWLPWALAACLAICCGVLALERVQTHRHMAALEKRNVMAQMQIATLASQIDANPKATAVVLWDAAKQEGVLKVNNVPPNESTSDYQLWIVDPEYKQPVNAGTFQVKGEGTTKIEFKPKEHVGAADAFAVSLERKGGSKQAEGPMVLLGK